MQIFPVLGVQFWLRIPKSVPGGFATRGAAWDNAVGAVKPGTGRFSDPLIPQEVQLVPRMQLFVPLHGTTLLFPENAQILLVFPHFPLILPCSKQKSSGCAQLRSGTAAGVCPAAGQGREDGGVLKNTDFTHFLPFLFPKLPLISNKTGHRDSQLLM